MQPPASSEQQRLSGELLQELVAAEADIRRLILDGVNPRKAVMQVWDERGLDSKMADNIMDGVIAAYVDGSGAALGTQAISDFKSWWLGHVWSVDGRSLKGRLARMGTAKAAISEIRAGLNASASWQKVAKSLTDKQLLQGDVAGYMWEVIKASKRAIRDPQKQAKYVATYRRAQRRIERLARDGAPTTQLKKAYQNVLIATEKGRQEAIEKSIERAVRNKARYNAERIARTELARAYGQGFRVSQFSDDDIVGFRSVLSSRHPEFDICDLHAGADFYGLGPGGYPKGQGPEYPYHPHCMCNLVNIYKGESGRYNPDAANKFVSEVPNSDKKKLFGVEGAKKVGKGRRWERLARNWSGHKDLSPEIPKRYWAGSK